MDRKNVYLRLHLRNGTKLDLHNIITAVFEKDYYLPYSKLSARAILPVGTNVSVSQVMRVELWYGYGRLHRGFPDRIGTQKTGSLRTLELFSRGVTVSLCQSQCEPGIWSQVNLREVVTRCRTTEEVSFEGGTDSVNYVYILEDQTSWDAVCAYALKAYSRYPYVSSIGTVRVTKSSSVTTVSTPAILEVKTRLDTTKLLTKLYMKDLNDDYSYSAEDSFAQQFDITREKYLPLDRQWLQDENEGLRMRLKYSKRACQAYSIKYLGYNNEDLTDKVTFTGQSDLSVQITVGALRVSFGPLGTETTLTQYSDGFLP